MEKTRRSCLALVAAGGGADADVKEELRERGREVLEGLVGLCEGLVLEEKVST